MLIGLGNRVFQFQNNLNGADWSRHIFVHSATVMALNQYLAMSPSSSVHCGQYDTRYATIGCVLRKAFADDTILGVHREPARNMRWKSINAIEGRKADKEVIEHHRWKCGESTLWGLNLILVYNIL